MNPTLASQTNRASQPSMIAGAAEFTVQQVGKIAVKSNHMDEEIPSASFSSEAKPQKSLLSRAIAPVMQMGYDYPLVYGGGYGGYGMGGYGMGGYGRYGMMGGYGGYGGYGMGYGGYGDYGMGYGGYGMGYGGYGMRGYGG